MAETPSGTWISDDIGYNTYVKSRMLCLFPTLVVGETFNCD
jgi:hypothetical protein